jgi:F-type H+-transporting ATPase subunit b
LKTPKIVRNWKSDHLLPLILLGAGLMGMGLPARPAAAASARAAILGSGSGGWEAPAAAIQPTDRPAGSTRKAQEGSTQGEKQGEAEAESPHHLLYTIVNFLILAVALGYLLRKPLGEFFSQRSQSIRKGLEEGRKALASAQQQLAGIEARLGNLEAEIRGFKDSAAQEMEAERQRLRRAAGEEAERTLAFARVQIEVATRGAKLELRRYTALEAVGLAQEIIRQRLDDPGRKRLVSRFVEGLSSKLETRN